MNAEQQAQIIGIVVNIFQNVGIKRWINQISILCNQQIYFQICKIIFPEKMIRIFQLDDDDTLTTGQKIQGVIDIAADVVKNNLYHIEGNAIAQGKIKHLRNFLELLEALSDNAIIHKGEIDVRSAPDVGKSQNSDLDQAYYTVIGIDQEFNKPLYNESENGKTKDENYRQAIRNKNNGNGNKGSSANGNRVVYNKLSLSDDDVDPNQQPQIEDSNAEETSEQFPIQPKGGKQKKESMVKRKKVKFALTKKQEQNLKRKYKIKSHLQRKPQHSTMYPLRVINKSSNSLFQLIRKHKLHHTAKTHQIIEELEKKQIYDKNNEFQKWQQRADTRLLAVKTKIDEQVEERENLINRKNKAHEQYLKSLKGEKIAVTDIKRMFIMQKKMSVRDWELQLKNKFKTSTQLMNKNEFQDYLQDAILSNRHQWPGRTMNCGYKR